MRPSELSVAQLVRRSEAAKLALPFFQRDYVWGKKDVLVFLDSLHQKWPTGAIILWTKPRLKGRKFGPLRSNPKEITAHSLVLDGQQRIWTLQQLRENGSIELQEKGRTESHYFYFDLQGKSFVSKRREIKSLSRNDEGQYIDVEHILKAAISTRSIGRKYLKRKRVIRALRQIVKYKFPIVYSDAKKSEDAIEIFNRVNRTGKRVGPVEIAFALLKDRAYDISRRIADFQQEWARQGFDIGPRVLMNSFLIVNNINDRGYHITTRNAPSQIRNYLEGNPRIEADWSNVFARIKSALRFLKLVGFDSDQFLTSENIIAALAGYFERTNTRLRDLSTLRKNRLKRWLYGTIAYGRYTYTPDFVADLQCLQNHGQFDPPERGKFTDDGLIGLMYAIGRMNGMTDYEGEKISWTATMERSMVIQVDHIYPFSRLTDPPISGALNENWEELADNIGNRTFTIGETNQSKSKKFPGEKIGSAVRGQWLDDFSLLNDSDYRRMGHSETDLRRRCREIRRFITYRRGRIIRDVEREIR